MGIDIYYLADRVYNCSGNHVFEQGKEVYKTDWKLPDPEAFFLLDKLADSSFYRKTGNHLEERTGTANFSIVGRNCNFEERVMYREWDEHKNERRIIAEEFNSKFPDIEALVAGETGIDIFPRGANKGQIWEDINIMMFTSLVTKWMKVVMTIHLQQKIETEQTIMSHVGNTQERY